MPKAADLARFIEHTLLRADATGEDIARLCSEAVKYGFHSVCVHPYYIHKTKSYLKGSRIKIASVVGFPLGMTLTEAKVYEAMRLIDCGAHELDIVINIGAAKSGDWETVFKDLSDVIMATKGAVHKVIIEACYLTDKEKEHAASAALRAGAGFVKTSTGFGTGGATVPDVKLIKNIVREKAGIKAAGGIKTAEQAMKLIEAGATRIGTSSGIRIIEGV